MSDEPNIGTKVYGDYTQAELNWEYDQSNIVPNVPAYLARAERESARVRAEMDCQCDLPYGDSQAERLDVFPARRAGAPVLIYLHGGAWTRGDKSQCAVAAEVLVPAGAAYVAINFGLVPAVTLDDLVTQARRAVCWVYANAREFGADPAQVFLAGHSSGAHVVGMLLTTHWPDLDLPADVIAGAAATSGLYDLEPVRLSARNSYLSLDAEAARRNSPILRISEAGCPLIVGYGEKDHTEFRRQSIAFAAAWRNAGHATRTYDLDGMNHFDIPEAYGSAGFSINCDLVALMGLD